MNKNIMVAVEKIEAIIEDLGTEYTWKNVLGEDISYDEYGEAIPQERALTDRNKMLDVLRDFYSNQNLNDFITLFGVYCSHYIRYNLHTRLDDDDFGIKSLWDDIKNENLRKYLSLIQEGINYRKIDCFKESVTVFSEYSLPYLYLFLDAAKEVFIDKNVNVEQKMALFYNNMDKELREYAIGKSKYTQNSSNPAVDENPLPYLCFMSQQDGIVKAMMSHYETLKDIVTRNNESFEQESDDYIGFQDIIQKLVQINDENEKKELVISLEIIFEKLRGLDIFQYADSSNLTANDNKQDIAQIEESKNDDIVYRLHYLNIPTKIPTTVKHNALELFSNKMELIKANEELKKAYLNLETLNKKNTAMVRRYSHVWTNILYPDVVLNVAKKLLNSSEYKEDAKRLLFAYNNENMMKQQVKMLELRHSDNSLELKTQFRKCIAKKNDLNENLVSLDYLINYAFERVLFRIFMESSERVLSIRSEFESVGLDIENLRIAFEQNIIVGRESCFEWINSNIMKIHNLKNEFWNILKIKKNSYACDFLIEVFIEIFINLLTYSSKKINSKNKLEFDEVKQFDTDYLRVIASNSIDKEFGNYRGGTEEGIKSLEEVLKMINSNFKGENELKQYIEINKSEDTYKISILFRRDLFIRGRRHGEIIE